MSENCTHVWIPKRKQDGTLDFRMNRQLSAVPLVNIRCEICNARSWMTKAQWDALPEADDAKACD